jgi:hypothetical protein
MAGIALCLGGLTPPVSAQVDGAAARRAIERGVRYLRRTQLAEGRWPERYYAGGETALAVFALLQAGESPTAAHMRAALDRVRQMPNEHVYVVALKILALSSADAVGYALEIRDAARWLARAQVPAGLWGYGLGGQRWDHSNSQYALLGLYAAAEAGVSLPGSVWAQARARVLGTQNDDGGWAYRAGGESYGSMTAANVSNLVILGGTIAMPLERSFENGVAPRCGNYRGNRPLINGLGWLARNFRADQNPGHGNSFQHYWLYAVERAGILSGRRYFGAHEWYREGAARLIGAQNADGSWGGSGPPIADTAFGLLFLAKGHKPLLVQKLQWSDDERWNPDRHDIKHLVEYIDDKFGEPTAWQVVEFDSPLKEWLAAPLLYVQGHTFPSWNEAQRKKMRDFVEQGGTVFFEACCGREAFGDGVRAFAAEAFPEAPLRELDAGHPVFRAHFDLPPRRLYGVDVGCRTSVLFSPNDLSCLWEQRDVPVLSDAALKLGTNIAAFATGRQALRDRLEVVTVPDDGPGLGAAAPAAAALRLGQVVYDGDWRPDAQSLVHFAEMLRDDLALDVVTGYQSVRLDSAQLPANPILYLTGHFAFSLSDLERSALGAHLWRGGFLFADACCGREAFDASFRALAVELFPDNPLERLPPDHSIFRGRPGFAVTTVGYKEAVQEAWPDLDEPELWAVTIDGRLVVVYSPYAIGCGLDGHTCYNCRGLIDGDARRVAANIVLYALTN